MKFLFAVSKLSGALVFAREGPLKAGAFLGNKEMIFDQVTPLISMINDFIATTLCKREIEGEEDFALKSVCFEAESIKTATSPVRPLQFFVEMKEGFWIAETKNVLFVFESKKEVVLGEMNVDLKSIEKIIAKPRPDKLYAFGFPPFESVGKLFLCKPR